MIIDEQTLAKKLGIFIRYIEFIAYVLFDFFFKYRSSLSHRVTAHTRTFRYTFLRDHKVYFCSFGFSETIDRIVVRMTEWELYLKSKPRLR